MLGSLRLAAVLCLLLVCIRAASARLLHPGIRGILARGAAAARADTVTGQRLPAIVGASRLGRHEMPLDSFVRSKVTSLRPYERVGGLQVAGVLAPFYDVRLDAERPVEEFGTLMDLPVPASIAAAIDGTDFSISAGAAEAEESRLAHYLGKKGEEQEDAKLLMAIRMYVAGEYDMNAALRSGNLEQCKRYFPYLRLLFEACANVLPPAGWQTLYRGVDEDVAHEYVVDSTVTWLSVNSCSKCNDIAERFLFLDHRLRRAARGTLFVIEALNAYDLSGTSAMSWEKESILLPGTRLKVLRVEPLKDYNVVFLQEVQRAFPLAQRRPSRSLVYEANVSAN